MHTVLQESLPAHLLGGEVAVLHQHRQQVQLPRVCHCAHVAATLLARPPRALRRGEDDRNRAPRRPGRERAPPLAGRGRARPRGFLPPRRHLLRGRRGLRAAARMDGGAAQRGAAGGQLCRGLHQPRRAGGPRPQRIKLLGAAGAQAGVRRALPARLRHQPLATSHGPQAWQSGGRPQRAGRLPGGPGGPPPAPHTAPSHPLREGLALERRPLV